MRPWEPEGTREVSGEELAMLEKMQPFMMDAPVISKVPKLSPEFEVPEGAMKVRMKVGDGPIVVIGWVESGDDVPALLESVAEEIRNINEERKNAT